jgi:hypothetical protein
MPHYEDNAMNKPQTAGTYDSSAEKVEAGPALACVALWSSALPGTGLAEKVSALRPGDRRCMVAHMFNACVRAIEQLDDIVSEKGV